MLEFFNTRRCRNIRDRQCIYSSPNFDHVFNSISRIVPMFRKHSSSFFRADLTFHALAEVSVEKFRACPEKVNRNVHETLAQSAAYYSEHDLQ